MKVRLLCSRAGNDTVAFRGDVVEVPNDEGQRMIAKRQAVPADHLDEALAAARHEIEQAVAIASAPPAVATIDVGR